MPTSLTYTALVSVPRVEVISRWWGLYFDCLGGLTDAVDGSVTLSAALLNVTAPPPSTEGGGVTAAAATAAANHLARAQIARWGVASYALLFEARRVLMSC